MSNKQQPPSSNPPRERVQVATYLAMGFSQAKAAKSSGVARSTVQRWLGQEDFKQIVNDLKRHSESALLEASKRGQLLLAQEFEKNLRKYMRRRQEFFEKQIETAEKMMDLVDDKVEMLEAEHISPNILAGMITGASKVADQGFAGWAEQLGIQDLQRDMAILEERLAAQEAEDLSSQSNGGETIDV